MFGIGTSEILIILLIALLVLGPKEIPKVARTIGRTMRELQRVTDELKHSINSEIQDEEGANTKPPERKEEVKEDNKPSSPEEETKKETLS